MPHSASELINRRKSTIGFEYCGGGAADGGASGMSEPNKFPRVVQLVPVRLLRLEKQIGKRKREQIGNGRDGPARRPPGVVRAGARGMKGDGGVFGHAFG